MHFLPPTLTANCYYLLAISFHTCVLIDSGAEENFLDEQLAKQLLIPLEPLPNLITARALNGMALTQIRFRSAPACLVLAGNHREQLTFHILDHSNPPVVLGHPWLQRHNPQIDWIKNEITSWGVACHSRCLQSALTPASAEPCPATPVDLSSVPAEYHDLAPVFSKEKAMSLPPHRPYDCAIDLLPGAALPRSRLYNLSKPEQTAMENYIRDSLAAGIIRPSSSPVGAGFFFVDKRDSSLRPCIDYRGLNDITVKNTYPLPLINSAFTSLHGANLFTKLDLVLCLPPDPDP